MQERDGGNPAWRLPRLLVSILLARRVAAAALSPFAGCMRRRPLRPALAPPCLSLPPKPPLLPPRNAPAGGVGWLFGGLCGHPRPPGALAPWTPPRAAEPPAAPPREGTWG